jgi:restriction endonuclease S subunit
MLKNKNYTCEICKTKPDQLSHHKTHLNTQKHKDKKELFELKLFKLSHQELLKLYNTIDISIIVDENETCQIKSKILSGIITLSKKQSNETCSYINIENNKKLINNNINNIDNDMYKEMSYEEKQKVEQSNNVSNKEALKDKIHEIHNYLRNNGAGYGMNALKVFNLLYGLKKIEEKKLLDKVKLKRPDCDFSFLLKIANENKDEELTELILGSVSTSIYKSNISELLFYEIPTNIKSSVFAHLIKEIDKITIIEKTCNVLLSGKIYEYFIGRDESAISELGAYFTDRHIVDYIYKKLDPEINEDGYINSMIDMFGGSGGFTTGYINYLNNKYNDINWKDNINKIYHFDMNEDVVKSAGLEFFCLTGILPNMKDNLAYRNTFTDSFNNKKFMNVITNPPYGGDKIKQSSAQIKRKKIKEYIKKELTTMKDELQIKTRQRQIKKIEDQEKQEKQESYKTKVSVEMCSQRIIKYAKDNKLKGNDKESSSLILIMDMVDVGGTAIGVLKEGVFFNKSYKDIRKCLVENFNVKEIISVPQDQFENTSTKTSIVIFNNTEEKTTNVIFSELVVQRYDEDNFEEIGDEIVLTELKDDIYGISDILVSEATKEEILKNPIYSLNSKDYNKKEIICGEEYELVKLGDICESQNGYAFKTSEYKDTGVPLITITHIKNEKLIFNNNHFIEKNEKYKKYEIQKNDLIISLTGKKPNLVNIALNTNNKQLYLNQRCALLRNFTKIDHYYFLSIFNGFLINHINKYIGNGSNQENVSLTDILDLQLPVPKSKQKIIEWVDKISKPYDKKKNNEKLIMKLEENIKNKIKDIGENEDCDEVELGSICDINPESLKKNQFLEINYIDISSVKEGKINNIQLLTENFPSRAQRIIKKNDILFSTVRPNLKGYTFINEEIKNGIATSGFAVIRSKTINPKYIYSLLTDDSIIDFLMKNSTGTSYPAVNSCIFEKIKIKLPKNKQLIKDLEPLFQEIEKLQSEMKKAETQYKQLIKELSEEAIPSKKQLEIKSDNELNKLSEESNEHIIEEQIIKPSEKKSKVSKKSIKTQLNENIIEIENKKLKRNQKILDII